MERNPSLMNFKYGNENQFLIPGTKCSHSNPSEPAGDKASRPSILQFILPPTPPLFYSMQNPMHLLLRVGISCPFDVLGPVSFLCPYFIAHLALHLQTAFIDRCRHHHLSCVCVLRPCTWTAYANAAETTGRTTLQYGRA